jgi:hypothetical protein
VTLLAQKRAAAQSCALLERAQCIA